MVVHFNLVLITIALNGSELSRNPKDRLPVGLKCCKSMTLKFCTDWDKSIVMLMLYQGSPVWIKPYLYSHPFQPRSDHHCLKWLRTFKEPKGQVARWIEMLQEYDFEVLHRLGQIHSNADALSRKPCT